MFRAALEYLSAIKYVLNSSSCKVINTGTPFIITSARHVQLLAYHLRFSQLFYNSGLIYISGFDVTAGTSAIVYNFILGSGAHIHIIALCDCAVAPVSIESAFYNAT
jgi:hypothetical protein